MSTPDKPTLHCSFCGKSQHEVEWMIAGPGPNICSECVDLCADIVVQERTKAASTNPETPMPVTNAAGQAVPTEADACEIRLRCLELALAQHSLGNPIENARAWSDFVLGTRVGEALEAARKLAEIVSPSRDDATS